MTIDTLEYGKKLEAAGVERKLAEALRGEFETPFRKIETKLQLLTWMVGFNLAGTMAILWKLPC